MNRHSPASERWPIVVIAIIFVVLDFYGVAGYRDAAQDLGFTVPAWWYAVVAFPPCLAVTLAFLIPASHRLWRSSLFAGALFGLVFLPLAHIPLIYRLYGFDRPHVARPPATPSPQ
jgi:uncharacterized membrane protein YkvI